MKSRPAGIALSVAVVVSSAAVFSVSNYAQQPVKKVDFTTEVLPILRQNCVTCHGPKEQKNGLRLDRRKDAMRGGTIAVIGPGNADGSRLYQKLISAHFGPQMPPTGALPAAQIATIKAWIDQGAEWPDAVSGDVEPAPADPAASSLMDAIRAGDRSTVTSLVASNAAAAAKRGHGGATPLMYAALYSDVPTMKMLLDSGADAKATDDSGATALMWALTDLEKTKLLIDRGADVNARSADGRTPLLIASALPGSAPVVTLLLDKGADIKARGPSLFGDVTPLVQAAYIGDGETFKLLVERGADVEGAGVAALGLGMRAQCKGCVETMLKALQPPLLTETMLSASPPTGPALATGLLLERGADINGRDPEGRTALMLACASEAMPVDVVKMLIAKGIDVNAKSAAGDTALTYAKRLGNTPIVQLLEKAGAVEGNPRPAPSIKLLAAVSPRAAVERSLPLLQRADEIFLQKSACVSCHNNSLTAMTVAVARSSGITVDESIARKQARAIGAYLDQWRDRALQGIGIPGDNDTISYILLGLAAEKFPANASTDAMVRFLRYQQTPAGFWLPLAHRPPIEASIITATALTMRAIKEYGPPAERAVYDAMIARGAAWIARAEPHTTEDFAFKVLGLHWGDGNRDELQKTAKALLARQRPDGGWSQLPSLQSDAYATGQVLSALGHSGALPATDPVYKRGVQFLLKTQAADGSWFVRTRAIPIQPHFEAGFPYGRDQFVSTAATNWATMALAFAARSGS
jgi:ankyrin repeat protein